MKQIIMYFTLLFTITVNSQNNEIKKAIAIIEELTTYNDEMLVNTQAKTKIIYSQITNKVEFQAYNTFVTTKDYINIFTSIDLDDIITDSMVYSLFKTYDNNYIVFIEIKTKNKSVTRKKVTFDTKIGIIITDKKTSDLIKLFSGDSLSLYDAKKYIESIIQVLGITKSIEEEFKVKKDDN